MFQAITGSRTSGNAIRSSWAACCAAAVVAIVPYSLSAQEKRADLFTQLDVNKDGKVSRDELPDRQKENFGRIDANGDGAISRDELEKYTGGNRRPNDGSAARSAVEPTHAD